MWEHVNGLHGYYLVCRVEEAEVACLCGGIAADVYYAPRTGVENNLYHVRMHAGTWWVGDDDIRASVLLDEGIGKKVFHVACIEERVADAVELRV